MGIARLPRQIVVPSATKPLADCTWEEISYVSQNNLAEEWGWKVGDAKAITLNGTVGALTLDNYQTYAYIIGINHNAELEGNNLIHFQVGKSALTGGVDIAFVDSYYRMSGSSNAFRMNLDTTALGGWKDSYMRNNICGTSLTDYPATSFLAVIPDDLRAALRPVIKYTNNTNDENGSIIQSDITATSDYVFILSQYEILAKTTYINPHESDYQQQYTYYLNEDSRLKYRYDNAGIEVDWWLRSPSNNGYNWVDMPRGTSDSVGMGSANYSYGFAPCFCV